MLKIEVTSNKESKKRKVSTEIRGSLGEIISEYSDVTKAVLEKIKEVDKGAGVVFIAAVSAALFDVDEETAVDALKQAIDAVNKEDGDKD